MIRTELDFSRGSKENLCFVENRRPHAASRCAERISTTGPTGEKSSAGRCSHVGDRRCAGLLGRLLDACSVRAKNPHQLPTSFRRVFHIRRERVGPPPGKRPPRRNGLVVRIDSCTAKSPAWPASSIGKSRRRQASDDSWTAHASRTSAFRLRVRSATVPQWPVGSLDRRRLEPQSLARRAARSCDRGPRETCQSRRSCDRLSGEPPGWQSLGRGPTSCAATARRGPLLKRPNSELRRRRSLSVFVGRRSLKFLAPAQTAASVASRRPLPRGRAASFRAVRQFASLRRETSPRRVPDTPALKWRGGPQDSEPATGRSNRRANGLAAQETNLPIG